MGAAEFHTDSGRDEQRLPFRMADKEIDDRPEHVQQRDHQHPRDLFTFRQTLILDCRNQHPDPKREQGQEQREQKQPHCQ